MSKKRHLSYKKLKLRLISVILKGDTFEIRVSPSVTQRWHLSTLAAEAPFWSFFSQKWKNFVFTLVYPILSNLQKKSILHYNTRFSWIFCKKSKVATLGFFQKKAKNWVLTSSRWPHFWSYLVFTFPKFCKILEISSISSNLIWNPR